MVNLEWKSLLMWFFICSLSTINLKSFKASFRWPREAKEKYAQIIWLIFGITDLADWRFRPLYHPCLGLDSKFCSYNLFILVNYILLTSDRSNLIFEAKPHFDCGITSAAWQYMSLIAHVFGWMKSFMQFWCFQLLGVCLRSDSL